jgi:hypothetical protein
VLRVVRPLPSRDPFDHPRPGIVDDLEGGDPGRGLELLRPFVAHLSDAGLGSISEILEPDLPFDPRGCPFQAWSVAEVLRAWRSLSRGRA